MSEREKREREGEKPVYQTLVTEQTSLNGY
jgi:hypothetical protein